MPDSRTGQQWNTRRLEATVQTAALCAYVDGHLAKEEREKLCACIARFAESEEEAKRLVALVGELPEWTRAPGSRYRPRQLAEVKTALTQREEREHAFRLAVHVAKAHRGIGPGEHEFLLHLMRDLEIEGPLAREMLALASDH
jgi:tellurite resistance protein